MRISYKTDYALKTLLYLAENYQKRLVQIPELAKELDIPQKFLEQVFIELRQAKFVESKRGKNGGYTLATNPQNLIVGNVLRYLEGSLEPIACVQKDYKDCADIATCVLRNIWCEVNEAISKIVDNKTFADLLQEKQSREAVLNYDI